tara:strand:+ start:591 stop:743 length:153 start_codon:yes stop_codon:yes gene_type:complete
MIDQMNITIKKIQRTYLDERFNYSGTVSVQGLTVVQIDAFTTLFTKYFGN